MNSTVQNQLRLVVSIFLQLWEEMWLRDSFETMSPTTLGLEGPEGPFD